MPFPPHEPWRAGGVRVADELNGAVGGVVIHRLHALARQRAGVLDLTVGLRVQHAARAERLAEGAAVGELHVARIVLVLRLFLGIQMVEVAVELVEAVVGGQMLVAVPEVVLAELSGSVAEVLQDDGDGGVLDTHAELGAGQADLAETGAEHALPGDERRASGGAALLGVVVGEDHAFPGDAIDVRRAVAHHPHRVGRDVASADVVTPDDQDVGLLGGGCRLSEREGQDARQPEELQAVHVELLGSPKGIYEGAPGDPMWRRHAGAAGP